MKKLLTIGLLVIITGFCNQALASMSCSEAFKAREFDPNDYLSEEALIQEFQSIRVDLKEAKNLTHANENIHALVVTSNKIMDRVIDYIIEVNVRPMHADVALNHGKVVERLVEELQLAFGIKDQAMEQAIEARVNREVQELQLRQKQIQQKRAIGFGRDQSSESFHSEKAESQPIGFVRPKAEGASKLEPTEKVSIGFESGKKSMEDVIREIVEFQYEAEVAAKKPAGFIPPKQRASDLVIEKQPIGFMRTRPEHEPVTPEKLHKLLFDLETGVFDFQKGDF